MEEMKVYTHEEMLDRVVGTKDTPARKKYDTDINNFLIGEERLKILPKNN